MKTLISKIVILISMLCWANYSYATIKIDSEILNNNDIKIFFINDFDLTHSGSSPLLFQFTITSDDSFNTKRISFNLRVIFNGLETGDPELLNGTTNYFDLLPWPTQLSINNQNLFSQTDQYRLEDFRINTDGAEEVINTILSSGKLPSGTYQFLVSVIEQDSDNIYEDQDPIIIEISNPTTLDLIAPGEPTGLSELMEIYTSLPLFRWESDASEFRLKVCEKLSVNNSPDDVMNNDPRLETTVEATTFQYPLVGALPLYAGKTYFWQVIAITQSSSGPIEMESEIWGFKIADMSAGLSSAELIQIKNTLGLLLPEDLLDMLFDENGELAGYSPTGVILKDGTSISLEELKAFIDQILSGKIRIIGHSIE